MDWTKAKNIIIAALLITDLILAGSMFYNNAMAKSSEDLYLQNTISVLKDRNISIDAELPTKQSRMPVLTVEYDQMDALLIQKKINEQKTLPKDQWNEAGVKKLTDNFLQSCGLMTENVKFDSIQGNNGNYTLKYSDIIKGIPIEESYMNCSVKEGKVETIDRIWLKPLKLGKTKKQVIPIAQALIKFMSINPENAEITIQKIELVYWLDTVNLGLEAPISDTAFPAWKITYNDGKIIHIQAFEQ